MLKGISLFFFYPLILFVVGFYCGVRTEYFFYPGSALPVRTQIGRSSESPVPDRMVYESVGERVCADTEFVLYENDLLTNLQTQTNCAIPYHYIGLSREQLMQTVQNDSLSPPLEELEKGFVSEELVSFSPQRVVLRKNYRNAGRRDGLYLAVRDHELVAYCADLETVYTYTGIRADVLPESIQLQIFDTLYMENEAQMEQFLKTYTG